MGVYNSYLGAKVSWIHATLLFRLQNKGPTKEECLILYDAIAMFSV